MNVYNWPKSADGVDAAAVIDEFGEVVYTGSREECEYKAQSKADSNPGFQFHYAVKFEGHWVHKNTFYNGEGV